MTTLILAFVPVAFITGGLAWVMSMGARDQARSDAWAARWMQANASRGGR
ncbi:hypothetical protein [Rubrivivax albus]|nr:hypothetical protein [Rubrivivax albus]MCB1998099.1 hypothetical protein [Rhodoferax sp.]